MKQITIDITCEACHGTGLYSGFAEPWHHTLLEAYNSSTLNYEKFKKMDESLKKVQEQCFPKKEEPGVVENFKLVARLKAQDGYGRRDMVQRLVAEGYTVKEDIVKKEFSGVPDYFLLVYEKA